MTAAIIPHLWQSTVFGAAAAALAFALRRNRASVRFWIWTAASIKFLVPFALLVGIGGRVPVSVTLPPAAAPVKIAAAIEQAADPIFIPTPRATHTPPTILLVVWSLGFLAVIARWTLDWRRARRSTRLEPGVFGVFRPRLVLPDGIADRLTAEQLAAIEAHERCHIRRRDNLWAAIHMSVEAIFWFHPLVWWIGARLLDERERACDEEVLRQGSAPETYAGSILAACRLYLESPVACVAGVTGADLKRRIENIMSHRVAPALGLRRKALLAVCGAAAVCAPIAVGLVDAAQEAAFEVASVKPVKAVDGPLRVTMNNTPGGVNYSNATLKACIRRAYGLKTYQVVGGPAWIGVDRFNIVAKTARPTAEDRVLRMLQALLADRFHLEVHRETREMPVYSLVVAKGGPKLPKAKSSDTEVDGDAGEIRVKGATLSLVATTLTQRLDRPVLNKTGLDGRYDFVLKFAPETGGNEPAEGPSIFTALQEQLGLKLEAAKGPVDVVVIDSAQKPSEN